MFQSVTIGQKLGMAFAVTIGLTALLAFLGVRALQSVIDNQDDLVGQERRVSHSNEFGVHVQRQVGSGRAFFLTKEERFAQAAETHAKSAQGKLNQLRSDADSEESRRLLAEVGRQTDVHTALMEDLIRRVRKNEEVGVADIDRLEAAYELLDQRTEAFEKQQRDSLEADLAEARANGDSTRAFLIGVAVTTLLVGSLLAFVLSRRLTGDLSAAILHLQSSSSELHTAAAQQAAGTKEQASAASEVSTTLKELVSTARQIGESAQRVAELAEESGKVAQGGNATGVSAQDAVSTTKRQVDLIVHHMLDLGKKSQQIGGVLDIINELSEQTNILSINATIEAAGAGEAGARFSAVADEIRKLADRTASSTKEIRMLVEEIRSGVNSTVMVTEGGSKAADAAAKQITEVAAAFSKIAEAVVVTAQAAKEIELSTKQQTTAVEQVNVAVAGVAQAAKDSEASTGQTVVAATQLSKVSRDLTLIVRSDVAQ